MSPKNKYISGKRFVFYAIFVVILALSIGYFRENYLKRDSDKEIFMVLDSRVVSGKVESYWTAGPSENIFELHVRIKDVDERVFEFVLTNEMEIISHFPRAVHGTLSAKKWLKDNPNGNIIVGTKNGIVQQVILHPAGSDDNEDE